MGRELRIRVLVALATRSPPVVHAERLYSQSRAAVRRTGQDCDWGGQVKTPVCPLGAAPISPRERSVPRNVSPESRLPLAPAEVSRMLEPGTRSLEPNHFPAEHRSICGSTP